MSNIVNLKEISERFNNGTETIEDIMNYCRNYEIQFGSKVTMRVVEKKYFDKLVERIKELEEEIANKENKTRQLKETIQDLENECVSLHELIDEEM